MMLTSFPWHPYYSSTVQRASLLTVEGLCQVYKDRIYSHVLFDAFFLNLSHCKDQAYGNAFWSKTTLSVG